MFICAKIFKIAPRIYFRRHFSLFGRKCGKLDFQDPPEAQKTTLSFASKEPTMLFVPTAAFVGGFRFRHSSIIGSLALLPSTVLQWKVSKVEDINENTLALFTVIYPPLDIIVVGTGNVFQRLDPKVHEFMSKCGISIEVQDTKNACGTYALLQDERPGTVGAALLPLTGKMKPQLPHPEKRKRLLADTI